MLTHASFPSLLFARPSAQRFARLGLRDHKLKYLADTPRFVTYIRATCSRYRELFPLLRLIDRIEGQANVSGYAFGRV